MYLPIFLSQFRVYTWPIIHSGFLSSSFYGTKTSLVPLPTRLFVAGLPPFTSAATAAPITTVTAIRTVVSFHPPSCCLVIVSDICHQQARACPALEAIQIVARSTLGSTAGWKSGVNPGLRFWVPALQCCRTPQAFPSLLPGWSSECGTAVFGV